MAAHRQLYLALCLLSLAAARDLSYSALRRLSGVTDGLEPASVFANFEAFSAVPRSSHNEQQALEFLKKWADGKGLEWQRDKTGNLVVRRPGSGGGESAPPVILQGHVDMVAATAEGVNHDFNKDGITIKRDGDWLKADGTTLGADDGIGVAAIMSILELPDTVKLPPVEGLFTLNEEDGMTGAAGLDPSMLKGRTLLNLDSESWPELIISAAGAGYSSINLSLPLEDCAAGGTALTVSVGGLLGGHSGVNIGEDRANAIKVMASLLERVMEALPDAQLAVLNAGAKRNAIPSSGSAVLVVPKTAQEVVEIKGKVEQRFTELKQEFGVKDTGMNFNVTESAEEPQDCLTAESADTLIGLLRSLPTGTLKWSHVVEDLVESSTNLGIVNMTGVSDGVATYDISMYTRSSLDFAWADWRRVIKRIAESYGADVYEDPGYPGWPADPESRVVNLTALVIKELIGADPKLMAVHAGLEVSTIQAKIPGTDAVSLGPTLLDVHSPAERLQISTVQPFYDTVLGVLEVMADEVEVGEDADRDVQGLGRKWPALQKELEEEASSQP